MYTKKAIIYDTPRFQVISYGNGAAYTMRHKGAFMTASIQGEEADLFRKALEEDYPRLLKGEPYDSILGAIWLDFGFTVTADLDN